MWKYRRRPVRDKKKGLRHPPQQSGSRRYKKEREPAMRGSFDCADFYPAGPLVYFLYQIWRYFAMFFVATLSKKNFRCEMSSRLISFR